MTQEQIELRYYLGHKEEIRKLQAQAQMLAVALMGSK